VKPAAYLLVSVGGFAYGNIFFDFDDFGAISARWQGSNCVVRVHATKSCAQNGVERGEVTFEQPSRSPSVRFYRRKSARRALNLPQIN